MCIPHVPRLERSPVNLSYAALLTDRFATAVMAVPTVVGIAMTSRD